MTLGSIDDGRWGVEIRLRVAHAPCQYRALHQTPVRVYACVCLCACVRRTHTVSVQGIASDSCKSLRSGCHPQSDATLSPVLTGTDMGIASDTCKRRRMSVSVCMRASHTRHVSTKHCTRCQYAAARALHTRHVSTLLSLFKHRGIAL